MQIPMRRPAYAYVQADQLTVIHFLECIIINHATSKISSFKRLYVVITVNLEIFVRVLFSRNFAYFVKIKPLPNGKITLSFTDIGKSCLSREVCERHIYVF